MTLSSLEKETSNKSHIEIATILALHRATTERCEVTVRQLLRFMLEVDGCEVLIEDQSATNLQQYELKALNYKNHHKKVVKKLNNLMLYLEENDIEWLKSMQQ